MAHNRTTGYSAPYRRNNLLGLHQYVASESFPSLGTWDRAKSDDMYVVRGTTGRSQPVSITMVGAISSDKSNLQPHGNYNPSYTSIEELARKARLQFYLTCPADDPDFASDYVLSLKRLRKVQDDIAGEDTRREHFIEGNNLKMNFLLFEEKEVVEEPEHKRCKTESDDRGPDGMDDDPPPPPPALSTRPASPDYEVASPYKDAWDIVSKTHHNNIMEVYGVDELPVDYRRFPKVLVSGTTVLVSFNLKHYAIKHKTTGETASDTFTALVQSVSILKQAEKRIRPTAVPKRRPIPVPQLPSRGTLKAAADAFAPVRDAGSSRESVRPTTDKRQTESTSPAVREPSPGSSPPGGQRADETLRQTTISKEMMSALLPVLLQELKNPSSQFFDPDLLASIGRPTSPSTSSSTASSGDSLSSPSRKNGSWVEVTESSSGDPATETGVSNSPSLPKSLGPHVDGEGPLSQLTSSDEEQTDIVEDPSAGERVLAKGKTSTAAGKRGKRRKGSP